MMDYANLVIFPDILAMQRLKITKINTMTRKGDVSMRHISFFDYDFIG